jgi:hypothetical protein
MELHLINGEAIGIVLLVGVAVASVAALPIY